ncbi:MAG: hypothetical protein U9R43_11300 [Thermodesulfobacteriota bacterium]|nr:hypothetical protein [Thermodesulfobacteriota bacterium]
MTVVLVVMLFATRKHFALKHKYLIFFSLFFMFILGGIIVNKVPSGVVLAGLRSNLKYLPFFFLPIVYAFSDEQIRRQLKFLLVLSLIQCPVTIYQRFIKYAGVGTGDVVGGTLGQNTSGVLSVYLACTISLIIAFYLKGRIKRSMLLILIGLLFLPTTLNETKVSLLLIPFALISPALFLPGQINKIKRILPVMAVSIVLMVVFVKVYDHIQGGPTVGEFVGRGMAKEYLYRGEKLRQVKGISRFDSIELAVDQLSKTGNLLLGVGIGNASDSFSDKLTGEYYKKYWQLRPGMTYLSYLLWEQGFVGVLLFIFFFGLVLQDSIYLSTRNDIAAAISLGWISVVMIIFGSFVYFNTFYQNIFGYLFWYFSGYIAAQRYRADIVEAKLSD